MAFILPSLELEKGSCGRDCMGGCGFGIDMVAPGTIVGPRRVGKSCHRNCQRR